MLHDANDAGEDAPVTKTLSVPLTPEAAFDLFTERTDTWWPFETHAICEGKHTAFRFEGREGGQIVETEPDGNEHFWGTVTTWMRPRRVSFSWHPGRSPESAQRVDVTFEPADDGTRVTLVHDGWEILGERARDVRSNHDTGWDVVFVQRYGAAAGS